MDSFDAALLRLKQQLKVTEDKEVAARLGLSASALNMRKKRGNFPTKEVFALAAQSPELGVDPDWVVTGTSSRMETDDKEEAYLMQCYRLMSQHDKGMLLKIAATMADVANLSGEEIERRLGNYNAGRKKGKK
ncbi:transcriptional regulator (plasmid) [Ralstonia pseudosolanacearum]|uniref:helix-turn-helix domain-containing protein n=1 Tax=Ralstonia pseudosolanacearum TaxID=1310165 RepID=UPI00090B7E5C|nr:helix-turn-helix domain-containing protein [Ralstonia pseudosolanacearum]API77979.1 transcriptional regulator [Ralstonia pseudosolanacearum]